MIGVKEVLTGDISVKESLAGELNYGAKQEGSSVSVEESTLVFSSASVEEGELIV